MQDLFNSENGVAKRDTIQNANVEVFSNACFGDVRVIIENGEPLFCAMDVCIALGYANGRESLRKHVSEEDVTKRDTLTEGGVQQLSYINESGLYSLIFGSKKESAKIFKDWVTHEVLPSIRKTGSYSMANGVVQSVPTTFADALRLAYEQQLMIEQQNAELGRSADTIAAQTAKIAEDAPKVAYYEATLQAQETYTFTQMAKELNFRSERVFTKSLLDHRIVYRQSDMYMLYSDYAGLGLTKTKTHNYFDKDGNAHTKTYTVWTEEGRRYLHYIRENGKV